MCYNKVLEGNIKNMDNTTITESTRHTLPSAPELIKWAFSFYKQHLSVIVGISAFPFLLGIVQILADRSLSDGLMLVLIILVFVVSFLSEIALFAAITREGQTVSGAYKKSLQMLIPYIWVGGLVSVATLGGFLLLIIPGFILSVLLSMSAFALFAENRRGISALISSWHYVIGYWGAVFWRSVFLVIILIIMYLVIGFVTAGPNIIELKSTILSGLRGEIAPEAPLFNQILSLFFNSFLFLPIGIIYSYGLFLSLRKVKALVPLESTDEQKIKKKLIILLVIGIILIVAIIALLAFLSAFFFFPQPVPSPAQ